MGMRASSTAERGTAYETGFYEVVSALQKDGYEKTRDSINDDYPERLNSDFKTEADYSRAQGRLQALRIHEKTRVK